MNKTTNIKKITEYRTPQKHSFEQFKEGCLLVPLDNNFKFDKWKGDGAKVNKERLRDFIREGVINHNPLATAKRREKIIDETIGNLLESVEGFVSPSNPCVAIAYPLNNIWIIAFLTEIFNPIKKDGKPKTLIDSSSIAKGMDISNVSLVEIKELNYDPYFYTYTIMQRASEEQGLNEVYEKSKEEVAKLEKLREEQKNEI